VPELTLESLAARVAELERQLAARTSPSPKPAWWDAVGMMEDNESTRSMLAEMEAASEAEREAALRGDDE
jgi:hypothetical protein